MTYTVQKGDTLSSIANKLGVDWRTITGFRSGNPNQIYVGETLTVPDKKAATTTPTKQTGGTQSTVAPKATTTTVSKTYQPAPNLTNQPYSQSSPSLWQNIKDLPKSVVELGRQIVNLAQNPSQIPYSAKEAAAGITNLPKSVQELGYQLTGGGAKTFGDLNRQTTTTQTPTTQNRPVVELASADQGGGGAYPAGYGPNDINPSTGRPWAWNPNTGKIDMAYYQSVMQNLFGDKKLSDADQAMLDKLKYSSLNTADFLKAAKEELTPYYDRLLKEANYDIDVALKFLTQDYELGLRQGKEVAGEALGSLMPSVKQEQRSLIGQLNKQGLLSTVMEPTTTLQATRPDTGAVLGGEQVAQYGGLAGKRLAEWQESAQARIEAITRALKRQEESSELEMAQQKEAKEIERQRKVSALEREKQERTATLAETNYGRALRDMQLKREEILRPYS